MKPRTSLKAPQEHFGILIGLAICGLIGSMALSAPAISKENSSPWSQWLEGDSLTGQWGGSRAKLQERGVEFFGDYTAELWGNITGGLQQETVYTGLLDFGLNLDLEKAIGWPGAKLRTKWLWLSGRDASADLVGNFLTISSIAGFNTFRNYELWFEQSLLDNKISLRLGQLAAETEFIISTYAFLFLNSTFGWPAFMSLDLPGGGPAYPMGTLGARLALNPAPWFRFQTAVFQGNVYPQNVNLHGFRWRLNSANGFFFLLEAQLGWFQDPKDQGLAGQFKAGGWFHTARFDRLDAGGSVRGNYGIYLILDQMLYREPSKKPERVSSGPKDGKSTSGTVSAGQEASADEKSTQGLGFFGRLAFEPQDRNFLGFYFDTGLSYQGLLPARDDDTLGVALAYAQLSSGARRAAMAEGSVGVGAEMGLEVTYHAKITKWLSLQPDLQFIIHPGGNRELDNALVIGCRATLNF